jgi:hypothetical protein
MERGPRKKGRVSIWGATPASTFLLPPSPSKSLWRLLEKDVDNLLREVDHIEWNLLAWFERLPFSTVLTKRHCKHGVSKHAWEKSCAGFHRFTKLTTTTRLVKLDFRESFLQNYLGL